VSDRTSRPWRVEEVALDVASAHGADLTGAGATRLVRHHRIERPALVLGSTQPDAHVDEAAVAERGTDVVRRRSGGGAVLLVPGDVVWLDVVIPAGDPLWRDDVGASFGWLGGVWVDTLASLGIPHAVAHEGALVCTRWSRWVCFGGVGPGEVRVEGRKVVGMSQRRTRTAARFQCAVLVRWDVVGILDLLALDPLERAAAEPALAEVAAGLAELAPAAVPTEAAVLTAFLAHLP
jgi:lipoate-protein ligase A